LVAVASFLSGRAKNLSAPPRTCVDIFVKSLIKSKWRYGRISTRYNVLQDVKLPFRYQAVVAGVVVVVSVTTEDSLISTSLVKLYY
jgi:hypothetical protein